MPVRLMIILLVQELKSVGVQVKSFSWVEDQFRKIEHEMGSYEAEYVPLQINKEDPDGVKKGAKMIVTEERPLVYHKDLKKYVTSTIKMLHEKNMLLLTKVGVTKGTIEILWSGDKSDSTFLFNFQVVNIENCQSPDNTHCALMFEGPDIYENLRTVFDHAKLGNLLQFFPMVDTQSQR